MNSFDISILYLPLGVALVALLIGFLVGRHVANRPSKKSAEPATVELPSEDDDADDPTAPISPMVEMARSPHDRHRDLVMGKSLVKQIDFLDAMIQSAEKKGDEDTKKQLGLLRKEFISLLGECSVESFEYPPGTVVDSVMRTRIQIVGGKAEGDRTVIAETVLCGFLYLHDDEDTMVLRKAEVVIG